MIHGNASRARARPARSGPAAWSRARALLLVLTMIHRWLPHIACGKARANLLRFLGKRAGNLEQIFRCLLILMPVKPAPFVPRASASSDSAPDIGPDTVPDIGPVLRRAPVPTLLSLSQLARGFEKSGKPLTLPEAREKPRRPDRADSHLEDPRGPTAAAPVADPFVLLGARLKAMRALLDDPHTHAAKFAARLKAAGITLRVPRPVIPAAERWTLLNCAALAAALPRPDRQHGLTADTS
ncbi:MAG: hypothetical protein CVT79_00620 [Alphaproteobacteria bacterium HGW-Alphaproteobacteria-18]|nr:MAG: hypothetical protein CVT79_00620 [Alphaproteobacteria bacterium HGW-Alphaproteobacteria-18]